MMNREYQRFNNWMQKHEKKIVYGMMYDGKIYRWNSYIPENPTKNYLFDMKRCLLDGVKLIDDELDSDVPDDIEKDTTNFMESKGVESRSAQGGGKLVKYFISHAQHISDDTQKKRNSQYVRDVFKNAILNDEEFDRIDGFDVISGLYRFLFDCILHYEHDCIFLPHANDKAEEIKLLYALERYNCDIDEMMCDFNDGNDVDYLLKLKEKIKEDKTILDDIKLIHKNLKREDDTMFL